MACVRVRLGLGRPGVSPLRLLVSMVNVDTAQLHIIIHRCHVCACTHTYTHVQAQARKEQAKNDVSG